MIKHKIVYNPACDYRFDLAKAEGSYLWDTSDNRYIDFSSGWNTTNLGWNNQEIADAVSAQAKKNVYAPMWTADPLQTQYASALTDTFPSELDVVCRATGGTEANEMALKIARSVTGRAQIVSFANTYHGQSFGTLALGFIPDYVQRIAPLVPEFIQMDYPSITDDAQSDEEIGDAFFVRLEKHLETEKVAAVFTEPGMITGWGSMLVAPKGYLTAVRKLTQKYGTLLVVDEVGTGFSRTGKLFAIEHEQVIPDMVTLAKGISNGAGAIGAVVTNGKLVANHIGEFKPTSTFGWNPLACAAALKTIEIHKRDRVWEEAERKGALVKDMLIKALSENLPLKNIRGEGLEIAFDVDAKGKVNEQKATFVLNRCFAKGLHLADAGECIQIMPPLTIPDEILVEGISTLIAVLKEL
jgi:4-aminobutyrate aminotransferase-like enzyme